jgi:hypothetical protein
LVNGLPFTVDEGNEERGVKGRVMVGNLNREAR